MKIVQVHNYYKHPGGEDVVVASELEMLRFYGNEVTTYYQSNDKITSSIKQLITVSLSTLWNHQTYREFRKLLRSSKPDIVHCHNTFPLISPSIFWACHKEGVPVVQTMHNYRMACLNAQFFIVNKAGNTTKSRVCERCLGKPIKWQGVFRGCYKSSMRASFVIAAMIALHKAIGTWNSKVTLHIALTEFQREKMIEEGLEAKSVVVKPNFKNRLKHQIVNDNATIQYKNPYALFVGRLSAEKGGNTLLKAWSKYISGLGRDDRGSHPRLIIVGDGPEKKELEKLCVSLEVNETVTFVGHQSAEVLPPWMVSAAFLIFPSLWHETFGLTVIEAGSLGTPSLVSSPTTTATLIENGVSGVCFKRASVDDLTEKISWAFSHPALMREMGVAAQRKFATEFSRERNYEKLRSIYEFALRVANGNEH